MIEVPFIETNLGLIPLEDYRENRASELGFDSYSEMLQKGFYVDLFNCDIVYKQVLEEGEN